MTNTSRRRSGGGAATSAGIQFQGFVTAYFAALVVAEVPAEPLFGLPAGTVFTDVAVETAEPVDDLNVGVSGGGVVFIQAKRAPERSSRDDSPLFSAFDQFARQMAAGVRKEGGGRRAFDPISDRLVLAVSHDTSSTVTVGLASLLDKLRRVQAPVNWDELNSHFNQDERDSLLVCRSILQKVWASSFTQSITADAELQVLQAVRIVPFDMRESGSETVRCIDVLRSVLKNEPSRAGDGWRALIEICSSFGPTRTGGDLEYLRSELERRGISLRPAASFHPDITALRSHTEARLATLRRLTELKVRDSAVAIQRPVVGALREFATKQSCAVVGAPGAGKTRVLYDLAVELRARHDVVFISADVVKATSSSELAGDLGLTKPHTLTDVLANWPGESTAFLIVDALDAARVGLSLSVLCDLIAQVGERAPRWHVVASIREYDLRVSSEVQDIFKGRPQLDHADPRFRDVRHVCVKPLSDSELQELGNANSDLKASIEAADKPLAELLRNPFNVSLLCKLIDVGVASTDLRVVKDQLGLLDLYWDRRVDRQNERASPSERRSVLGTCVDQMVSTRELHASRVEIERKTSVPRALDAVLGDGILVDVADSSGSGSGRLGFAHNILFDYAVHRLWVQDLSDSIISVLSQPSNHDLLLAIRPSIVMSFERLWLATPDRKTFWNQTLAVQSAPGMHLIGMIIGPGVAAQKYGVSADFGLLLSYARRSASGAGDALKYTVEAAITQFDTDEVRHPVIGEGAPDWMGLALDLCSLIEIAAWQAKNLIAAADRSGRKFTAPQAQAANRAAVALVTLGMTNAKFANVVRPALEVAMKTIAADVEATSVAVRSALTPDAVRRGGHEWLPAIAEHFVDAAKTSEKLAFEIVKVVFGAHGSGDSVSFGSRLLPFTMRNSDLVAMARHRIEQSYAEIMKLSPVLGTKIAIAVIAETIRTEHADTVKDQPVFRIQFLGKEATFKPDASFVWASGDLGRHDEWSKVARTFRKALTDYAHAKNEAVVKSILSTLRDENESALLWSIVLMAAAQEPKVLAPLVAELLASTDVLGEMDTRKAAGDCLEKGFEFLSQPQRERIEQALVRLPDATREEAREFGIRRRDRMLGCIPVSLLTSTDLKKVRAELDAKGGAPRNDPDYSISAGWEASEDDWWLREQGVQAEKAANQDLKRLSKVLRDVPRSNDTKLSAQEAASLLPLLEEATAAIATGRRQAADAPLVQHVDDMIISVCERLASARGLNRNEALAKFIKTKLRAAATSKRPEFSADDDAQWDKGSTGWGSPSPRIDAASGLMRFAASGNLVDPEILQDVEKLSTDPVPAVRYQVLAQPGLVYHTANALMWRCIEHCCVKEPRSGIVDHFAETTLLGLPLSDQPRLEPFVRCLFRRSRRLPHFDDVRRVCANYYLRRALWADDRRGTKYVDAIANAPLHFPVEATHMADLCRGLLLFKDASAPKRQPAVRRWAVSFLTKLWRSVQAEAQAVHGANSGRPFQEWSQQDQDAIRTLHQLAHNIATEVQFGLGAERTGEEETPAVTSVVLKRELLDDCASLFDAMSDGAFVEAAFDFVQTLEFLLEADPIRVLQWISMSVRKAESDGIQYESMAADVVVRIVERYLSEYAPLLRINRNARSALLDLLAVFVRTGWPSARRLTDRLGEMFR